MRIVLPAVCLALLAACGKLPESYSPLAVRPVARAAAKGELRHFTPMDAPDAANHIVSGILERTEGTWRWCTQRAELQFAVPEAQGLRFKADVTVAELTFKQTGKVNVEVAIDGRKLGVAAFEKPEVRTIEFDVPDGMVEAGKPVHVTLTADKEWVDPNTKDRRAFILMSAGFVQ
jgi:hypothetical protein